MPLSECLQLNTLYILLSSPKKADLSVGPNRNSHQKIERTNDRAMGTPYFKRGARDLARFVSYSSVVNKVNSRFSPCE